MEQAFLTLGECLYSNAVWGRSNICLLLGQALLGKCFFAWDWKHVPATTVSFRLFFPGLKFCQSGDSYGESHGKFSAHQFPGHDLCYNSLLFWGPCHWSSLSVVMFLANSLWRLPCPVLFCETDTGFCGHFCVLLHFSSREILQGTLFCQHFIFKWIPSDKILEKR